MTVYVEYLPQESTTMATRSQLWADTAGELHRFALTLGVPAVPWRQATTIAEPQRRRAILMGAIPVHTNPQQPGSRGHSSGVAA
ncbi:MAG: DUF4031 domain-containing protein [Streptosporangiales bacterium]|nr:DUF4031 domain-containing protein [Streptosporangiales bacterium]